MACSSCTNTKRVYQCGTSLILGTIASLSTSVYIYVKNIATGYEYRQTVTSSIAGLVTLDLTEPGDDYYNPNHTYEIKVTKQDGTAQPITISAVAYDCLLVEFAKAFDQDGAILPVVTQTIVIE